MNSRMNPLLLIYAVTYSTLSFSAPSSSPWQEVKLQEGTMCADGGAYSYFVKPGTSGTILFDFFGGGACWNDETCSPDSMAYQRSMPDVRAQVDQNPTGIYNYNRADNPFKNATHVIIPYCTGDIHWGQADVTYTLPNKSQHTVHHRGAINSKVAIDHILQSLNKTPDHVVVTGCSAGSYGSIWWSPYIRKSLPGGDFVQLGDSGAGVLTPEFQNIALKRWNVEASAPTWIPGLDPEKRDITKLSISDMYGLISKAYPQETFSQYNHLNDVIQRFFYKLMGGDQSHWTKKMRNEMNLIHKNNDNYTYFIAPWDGHCVTPYDSFYDRNLTISTGESFIGWLEKLLGQKRPPHAPCDDCTEES